MVDFVLSFVVAALEGSCCSGCETVHVVSATSAADDAAAGLMESDEAFLDRLRLRVVLVGWTSETWLTLLRV